jgi:DNA-binding NtrC family response regulator
LIVDDEPGIRFGLRGFLSANGYQVEETDSCAGAVEAFRTAPPDAAILDYWLPDGNALDLLTRLKEIDPLVPLVILTAHGSIDLAVRSIKEGADHFLTKPVELPTLAVILERLLDNRRNRQKQLAQKSRLERDLIDPFVGSSGAIRLLAEQAAKVAASESPILIQGETGSGKGILAAWLRSNGPRADEAFVDLNCAGLSRELLESELFGHEKGAFTGALAAKPGLLEVAHRGTVFLDEIGDLDLQVQPKLLKVIEEKRLRRLGEIRDRRVDIKLIAATHQDLAELVRQKRFRSDLYFRINMLPLVVPPLRHRTEDIPVLADYLLERLASIRGEVALTDEARAALLTYPWPGNIRELRNVLERAVLLSDGNVLTRRDLRFDASTAAHNPPDLSSLTLAEVERLHIEHVLTEERGRVERAAKRLAIPRSSLYQKIKKYGIARSKD